MSESALADTPPRFEATRLSSTPPVASPPPAQPFSKVAEAGLQTLKEIVAIPEAYFSGAKTEGLRDQDAEPSWNEARVRLREFQREADAYIRENPTKAVLGALGAGFVLGVLLKR